MRVTSEMMVSGSLRRLQNRLERYEQAQVRLSSGKNVRIPSDDPAQASRSLVLRAALRSREQELRAATDARSLANRADSELQSASGQLQRVRDLTLRAASETNPQERAAIVEELEELQTGLVNIANTKHRNRALFAGFQNGDAVAQVAGTWTYRGDQGQIVRRVSDTDRVQVNVLAEDVFGFTTATDTFTAIDNLIADITADNKAGIRNGLVEVDSALGRINDGLAGLGAAQNRIESAVSRTESSELNLRAELSDVEDVDIAEAVMDLELEEVAYQATLQALGRSLPDTLVSFLR